LQDEPIGTSVLRFDGGRGEFFGRSADEDLARSAASASITA
jgi:hypothetical protein